MNDELRVQKSRYIRALINYIVKSADLRNLEDFVNLVIENTEGSKNSLLQKQLLQTMPKGFFQFIRIKDFGKRVSKKKGTIV